MNIMKTNMLLLDNKIMKEDGDNTPVQAPVPSTVSPKQGMKALSFLGMKNLMANPELAMGAGVMNEKTAEKSSADSYVAPYSSNIAFQGNKFAGVAKLAGIAAAATLAGSALTSCDKDLIANQKQTVIVDVQPVVDAINALKADINANNKAQSERQQEILAALQQALAGLNQIYSAINAQTLTIEEFKELVLGKMVNGELQRSAILEAIMTLQNITEKSAIDTVNAILAAYERGQINFQEAMAKIQGLLKENNNLLTSILAAINDAVAKADEYAKSLLNVAQEINKNGKASNKQQAMLIEQNNLLIQQNNIQINQGQQLIAKVDELTMSVQELSTIAKMLGKSMEEVIKMSKSEIINAIRQNVLDLKTTNDKLTEINNNVKNNTMTVEEAAEAIIKLLGNIDTNVSEIKAMLANHFNKYDIDMADIKKMFASIKSEQVSTREEIKKLAEKAGNTSVDIKNMAADIREIRNKLNSGVSLDLGQLEELLKRINADQTMTREQIIAKLDAFLAKQDTMAGKLDETNENLTKLGFVVSNDVINAINNIGDDLKGLDQINADLKELLAAVKALTKSFDIYAKNMVEAQNEQKTIFNNMQAGINGLSDDLANIKVNVQTLVNQGKKAELQRANIEEYLKSLQNQLEKIEAKLGRIPTIEEFDAMLGVHDAANQEYYAKLIKNIGLNPSDFNNMEELLKQIKAAVTDFQGTSNKLLADILAKISAMDTSAPDYTKKLDKIIELMENFKFECNCQCDCDGNSKIHEGIIDIIS